MSLLKKNTKGLTLCTFFQLALFYATYLGPNLFVVPIVLPHCFNATWNSIL